MRHFALGGVEAVGVSILSSHGGGGEGREVGLQPSRFGSTQWNSVEVFQSLESLWCLSNDGPVLVGPNLSDETGSDRRPRFACAQDFPDQRLSRAVAGVHRRRVVFPQPTECVREDASGLFAVVASGAPGLLKFVAGELEGAVHVEVGDPPVATIDILVVRAVLQEDAQRLGLGFANEDGIGVATSQSDVGADGAEDPPKQVGAFPGDGEGGNGSTGGAGNGTAIGVVGEVDRLADFWQEFLGKEARVAIAEAVVFVAAIVARQGVGSLCGGQDSGVNEYTDGHRHLAAGDEVVEDDRGSKGAIGGHVATAVLEDHQAGRFRRRILPGHINPVVPMRAGEETSGGCCEGVFGHRAVGHRGVELRVRTQRIFFGLSPHSGRNHRRDTEGQPAA